MADSRGRLPKIADDPSDRDLPVKLLTSVVLTSLPRDGMLTLDKALHPPSRPQRHPRSPLLHAHVHADTRVVVKPG